MEFWGVEVKAGETLKVQRDSDYFIHISQAALGESKKDKGNENIVLHLKVGDQKLVMGTLSFQNHPQISFDVVFKSEFELSHNWKNGSVFLCGYKAIISDDEDERYNFSDEDEDTPQMIAGNARKDEAKIQALKAAAASDAKPKGKNAGPIKATLESKDTDEDDDSDDEEDEFDEEGAEDMSDDSEEDDDDSEEDEETPKKPELSKKRANESGTKTPEPKKVKLISPEKKDGKKTSAHTATPHPAKKQDASANKQTPKSGGQIACKSCDRSFTSEIALQSHAKAKHK